MYKFLIKSGLLPTDPTEFKSLLEKGNPYCLRKRALDEPLTLYEMGRVLIHLNQRRGFLSNRKTDRSAPSEKSKLLIEISELEKLIEAEDCRTLGEYLASKYSTSEHQWGNEAYKVRHLHTRRSMFEKEFELIWNAQQKFHPEKLTDSLRDSIHSIFFFQRKMYWLKSSIGRCELEGEKRCPRADRSAQKFRLWQEINNLRYTDLETGEEKSLTDNQRYTLFAILSQHKERTFEQIRKDLRLPECIINYEQGKRAGLKGMETDAIFSGKKYFGNSWKDFEEEKKNDIVRTLLDENLTDEIFIQNAVSKWNMDEETAIKILDAPLPEKYIQFCLKAIEKLIPHLERGLPLMSKDNTPSALSEAGYFRPDQRSKRTLNYLPQPPDLPNPVVRQALHEFHKLINTILHEFGKPAVIHIELPRELKASLEEREEMLKANKERERRRNGAKQFIEECNFKATYETILRYLLWKDQEGICLYSGNPISEVQLFGGEVDIDHILPYSRCLDNSQANKVVCFRSANAEKGDRTPYEWLAETDPGRYQEILQRVRKLSGRKYKKFIRKILKLDDFINRQLTDTAYISLEVKKYVETLYENPQDVLCTKGQNTFDLRHYWGLDTVLQDDGIGIKNREDHRHHAVDAIVIALTDRSRLQQLSIARRLSVDYQPLPFPWEGFREDVEKVINNIWVSHRVQRKIHGALHEETNYGKTQAPGVFVFRKCLEDLTPAMIEDIRDEAIKSIVKKRLLDHGIDPNTHKNAIPKSVWKEPLTMSSGVPIKKVRLLKKDNTIQPIRDGSVCVKPGNTHHICLFKTDDGRRDMIAITMLDAINRIRKGETIIQRQHPDPQFKFWMSLSTNEMVLIEHRGKKDLYRYESSASTSKQMWFRHHTFAGISSDKKAQISKTPNTLIAQKVLVDRLGRIRRAND